MSPLKYKAYTYRDYMEMKPKNYYRLGGLGADIGGDEWEKRKLKLDKMSEYAKAVHVINKEYVTNSASRPVPPGMHKPQDYQVAMQVRQKMYAYAKKVPKPKLQRSTEFDKTLGRIHEAGTMPLPTEINVGE